MLSKNIAYYIDSYNGIFTFAVSFYGEHQFDFLLKEIEKNVKVKKVKLDYNPDIDNIETIKDTFLYLDLDTSRSDRFYLNEISSYCRQNNNVLLVKKATYLDLQTNTITLKPTFITYLSNIVFTIGKDIIKMIKNRYDTIDIVNHNIVAYMRDIKINQILED
jgi:hypothetical protein